VSGGFPGALGGGARSRTAGRILAVAGALLLVAGAAVGARAGGEASAAARAAAIVAAGGTVLWAVWRVHPAVLITGGVMLSPFSGHWPLLGIPGAVAPDRLLLVAGVLCVLLRSRGLGAAPPLTRTGINWLLAATVIYAAVSAAAAGTLTDKDSAITLFERFGILEFGLLLVAPIAFREARHREALLVALVALGGYLGLVAVGEVSGLNQLVFPRYILNPAVGIHFTRGRGPFLEAVTNGTALYLCGVAAAIAVVRWRSAAARLAAGIVVVMCAVGIVGTLERSVWLGAVIATSVMMLAHRSTRAYLLPALASGAVLALAVLAFLPGLKAKAVQRANNRGTVYDRLNLAHAGLGMVQARPLLGFGWASFKRRSGPFFEQNPNYPLTASDEIIHNLFLTYAAELGLVGLTLWAACLIWGVGSALLIRGPPSLAHWRALLMAFTVMYVVVGNFVFPQVFPNLMIWLLAGVVLSARLPPPVTRHGGDGSAAA
jgi:putative inorganic carbon (hco3(-)) transporter